MLELEEFGGADGHGGVTVIRWFDLEHRTTQSTERRTFAKTWTFSVQFDIPLQPRMATESRERRIILALQAVQSDQNLSCRRAAKIYEVSEATLRARMNGRQSRANCPINSALLRKSEEEAIVQYILDLDERGFPPRIAGVEDMANLLLEARNGGCVGKTWAKRFIARRQELKTCLNRVYNF